METLRTHRQPGFTLPAVLVVTAALLILAVGMLMISGIERGTARSYADRLRAELAARAALEEVRGILDREASNDDFIILQSTPAGPASAGRDPAPMLFLARGSSVGGAYSHRYVPLFSALSKPPDTPRLVLPAVGPLTGVAEGERIDFTALPYQDKVRAAWLPIRDGQGRAVARYAYWVEDLQGGIDPKTAGNAKGPDGTHARAAYPFPAPGLNDQPPAAGQPALDQIALFAIDPAASEEQTLGKTLIRNRGLLVSPGSILAAAGAATPLTRDAAGHLADPRARAAEENLRTDLRPYLERPLVPFAEGIDPSVAGDPKRNLNRLLSIGREAAVIEMAKFIREALPDFESRKGGFPDDYLKTLAANALDYADADSEPSIGAGYRGLDAFPLVSEFLMKFRWSDIRTENGRKHLILAVSTYVELWNMSNIEVNGSAEVSYETRYRFQLPPDPNFHSLEDLSHASPVLSESGGRRWLPAFEVRNLRPDEYRVFHCGTVTYTYDAAPASGYITSPISLTGDAESPGSIGYRMRWNGRLVDQSRGGVKRSDISRLDYPSDTKSKPRQRVRATISGQSHNRGTLIDNMGDPRMAFYIQAPQDANQYPLNYSPNRRNIRTGNIYNKNPDTIYGRVLPSEWPDGGHDSPYGVDRVGALVGMSEAAFDDEYRLDPDDARFHNSPPDLTHGIHEAPARLSNDPGNRFFSATELGRAYDPVMWQVRAASAKTNAPGRPWGDVLVSSPASPDHGGGNTLRIGRPEHPAFDVPGRRASHLLDLFHAGRSRSDDGTLREGPLVEVQGHVNLNTASRGALRAMIAGRLTQDPGMRVFTGDAHAGGVAKHPEYGVVEPAPDIGRIADRIAEAVIRSRPYASTGELATAREPDGTRVFGNPKLLPGFSAASDPVLQWPDSAAEETFARLYESSTVRSRNFRLWIVAQALAPAASPSSSPEVLAEVRKVFSVFADPGERGPDGSINPTKTQLRILHENDF
jgi:type II secretory pathway pseudopilin PulG